MTSHIITSFDSHHSIYNNRNYVHSIYSSTSRNQLFHPYLTTLPIPSIHLCENLLYGTKITEDLESTTSSSYLNSSSEHYDNPFIQPYDNPIEYLENYNIKQNLINLSQANENPYDNGIGEEINNNNEKSPHKSSVHFYLKNKILILYTCLICFLLLLIISIGIFLLNQFIHPVVIHSTVNNHYDIMNISTTTTPITSPLNISVANDHLPFPYSTCPPDRWGTGCKNICKPCGLGVCHSVTGKCICPVDIYGEFCDLWKVNDKPKRGDMMS